MPLRPTRFSTPATSPGCDLSTLAIAALIYGGWIALTLNAARLPGPLLAAFGGWLIAWHGSLQHETIHGHPTASRRFNSALGSAPLSLWLPYARYRRLHLDHHATEHLTVPGADPESRYLAAGNGPAGDIGARLASTLLGRILLGPAFEIGGFLAAEIRALAADEPGVRRDWAIHMVGVAAIGAWLVWICHLSPVRYLLCFIYPGTALSLLRSFAEHRADQNPAHRIAVVEKAPILGLLFLNNNLHAAHHAFPQAPWRSLAGLYAAHRTDLLKANGGLVYAGYSDVARRYLFRPHDVLVHPQEAGPSSKQVVAA